MLALHSLSFHYAEQSLLNQISFNLSPGGLLHLKGANGTGKTTLLQLIAGLRMPHQGNIQWNGSDISHDLPAYQGQLCWVGHKPGFDPALSLAENCAFDLCRHRKTNAEDLASVFHLQRFLNTPCGLLSAGQKKQLSLLKLWMSEVQLWLLDEPLVALDDTAIHILMTKIAAHRAAGGMVLLTSHQGLEMASDYQEYSL